MATTSEEEKQEANFSRLPWLPSWLDHGALGPWWLDWLDHGGMLVVCGPTGHKYKGFHPGVQLILT